MDTLYGKNRKGRMNMKKILSVILVAALMLTAFCLPASALAGPVNAGAVLQFNGATAANAFGDLLDWTGIVFGNASNIIDLEGTLAVGGDFTSTGGLSLNSGVNGMQPASTEDVAFLVNGNVAITGYGNVYGQTVVGKADGNTYHLSNVTPSDTTNGTYTVADAGKYFADAERTAYAVKTALNALPVNGTCEAAYGTYTFVGDPDEDVLVYNVADTNISRYLFDFTIAEGQTVVVNLTAPGKIDFTNGGVKINGSMATEDLRRYNRNIIFNVTNATEITMTSGELYGILLAPDATLTGKGGNVCGTSILNGLTGSNGFELHVGSNSSFVPSFPASQPATGGEDPTEAPTEAQPATGRIRIDVPLKMAVAFGDGTVYYGGEMMDVEYNREYTFQMCAVNWDNGLFDDNGNGIRGTVVYRMKVVHQDDFLALANEAKANPERYIVKGMDIIDNEAKMIIINGDAEDAHLETDVNSFFAAYRFHFTGEDYDKKTGIRNVINTPLESLSVNLPIGSTIACDAYIGAEHVDSANVFITRNNGEGIYEDEFLTSVNDYTWDH